MRTGYYYSIAYTPEESIAQFSYIFYSQCDDLKLEEKLNAYLQESGFGRGRNAGPFSNQQDAEESRNDAKKQWSDSGYEIGGDNNFFGDCKQDSVPDSA